jgi:hypothetical protein
MMTYHWILTTNTNASHLLFNKFNNRHSKCHFLNLAFCMPVEWMSKWRRSCYICHDPNCNTLTLVFCYMQLIQMPEMTTMQRMCCQVCNVNRWDHLPTYLISRSNVWVLMTTGIWYYTKNYQVNKIVSVPSKTTLVQMEYFISLNT